MTTKGAGNTLIDDVLCISLTDLVKSGILMRGKRRNGFVQLKSSHTGIVKLDLLGIYNNDTLACIISLKSHTSEINATHRIEVIERPSNLGKGNVLFFICPITGTPCRKLYKHIKNNLWGCRTAFEYRLYYRLQTCSKREKYSVSYCSMMRQLNFIKKGKLFYKGKLTKTAKKRQLLERKRDIMDICQISPLAFPKPQRKYFPEGLEDQIRALL